MTVVSRPLRRIVQQDSWGCGVACVAMLSGKSYGKIRSQMLAKRDVTDGTHTKDLRRALADHGIELAHRSFRFTRSRRGNQPKAIRLTQDEKTWVSPRNFKNFLKEDMKLSDDAILAINVKRNGEGWHWVVWDSQRERILDPKKSPCKRIRPYFYLRVKSAR